MIEYELSILLHVVIASVLTGIIGYERERGDKPAGIRTNMLVGGSVALLVLLGDSIVQHFHDTELAQYIDFDPTRIIHAIIVGISFIGAGMVLQIESEKRVKYLTTAATILFSTGVGIAVALHKYILSVGATLFILFINYLMVKMAHLIKKR
jgi:putative Mg2+ transporter-C (MgtC) family protein